MANDRQINYIELQAADLDAAEAFYSTAFGWRFIDYGPDYRAFNDGTMDGGFSRGQAAADSASGSALVVLYAADLEATRDAVLAAGGTLKKAIFTFPGGRRFHFGDPHGNELAVWSDR